MLEQQTSVTVGSAASRLLEKDSKIRAANIRIKSLEKDLLLSRSHAEEVEDAYAEHRQLEDNYTTVQKDIKEMKYRNNDLEEQYKELASNLQDKEKALDIAQNLLKALDKKRLQELEQLGIALVALKNDHKNNLDKSTNEVNNLQKELERNQAIYDDNIISLDKKSMDLQVQYEEQLARLEEDFTAFKEINQSKGLQSVSGMQLGDVEYKEQNKEHVHAPGRWGPGSPLGWNRPGCPPRRPYPGHGKVPGPAPAPHPAPRRKTAPWWVDGRHARSRSGGARTGSTCRRRWPARGDRG